MNTLNIRDAEPGDTRQIYDLVEAAFKPMPYSDGDEQDLVDRLRDAEALSVSLVAELDNTVVGYVAISPATTEDGATGWYGLGPVAVAPDRQGSGIGGYLVRASLARLNQGGFCKAKGCILVGNPDYYQRFGFRLTPHLAPPGEPAEFFQVITWQSELPAGAFAFHPAFY